MPKAGSASRPDGRKYAPLRSRTAFQRVFRTGKRRRSGGVVVIVALGEPGPARCGVVAGTKTVGGAVQRNRAKRRLREALDRVRLQDGHEYVVIASEAVLTAAFPQLVGWLRRAIEEE